MFILLIRYIISSPISPISPLPSAYPNVGNVRTGPIADQPLKALTLLTNIDLGNPSMMPLQLSGSGVKNHQVSRVKTGKMRGLRVKI